MNTTGYTTPYYYSWAGQMPLAPYAPVATMALPSRYDALSTRPVEPAPEEQVPTLEHVLTQRRQYENLQRRRKQVPEDVLLDYSPLDKTAQGLKTLFVTLPKTIWKGLKGDDDYSFSDAMLVAKVPYYLGGVFLALSPFIGGNNREGIRQAAAVGLYLLGNGASNFLINSLYRLRYGVDLTMMYRSKTGQIERVFASSDFPRSDLLTHAQYQHIARKMGIPKDVYEQDGAVREQLRYVISSSRALKLITANLLSAIGAGYLARSDKWLEVPKAFPVIRAAWQDPKLGFLSKIGQSLGALGSALRAPLMDRLDLSKAALWQRVVVYGGLATVVGSIAYILCNGIARKEYSRGPVSAVSYPSLPRFNGQTLPETTDNRQAGRWTL